ncbi:MAG: methylated-DNA--[protein]-cysteine S-methyltransferase [Bacilli bacterium]|jgi:O-6-methylguanine DNA methyltransferase
MKHTIVKTTGIYDRLTPLGLLRMELADNDLVSMYFLDGSESYPAHPTLARLIDEYFAWGRPIDYPVRFLSGTPFQKTVWAALMRIPFGVVKTYKDIAVEIGHPAAFRAVGQACKRNPVGLVVPCHRVIGSDGSMTGYSGPSYVGLKQQLLNHEARFVKK